MQLRVSSNNHPLLSGEPTKAHNKGVDWERGHPNPTTHWKRFLALPALMCPRNHTDKLIYSSPNIMCLGCFWHASCKV
jgi:hypothetical protein